MKQKIVLFIIGLLVGAIVSTGTFYIYITTNDSNKIVEGPGGNLPNMPDRQNGENGPKMPNQDNSRSNNDTQENNQSNNK